MPNDPDAPRSPDANETDAETVNDLTAQMRVQWVVASQGSIHLWNQDSLTYTRRPGPASPLRVISTTTASRTGSPGRPAGPSSSGQSLAEVSFFRP